MAKNSLRDGTYSFGCPGGGKERNGQYAHFPLCPTGRCGDLPQFRVVGSQIVELNCDQLQGREDTLPSRIISGPFEGRIRAYDIDNKPAPTIIISG